jgi:hypothetical protein
MATRIAYEMLRPFKFCVFWCRMLRLELISPPDKIWRVAWKGQFVSCCRLELGCRHICAGGGRREDVGCRRFFMGAFVHCAVFADFMLLNRCLQSWRAQEMRHKTKKILWKRFIVQLVLGVLAPVPKTGHSVDFTWKPWTYVRSVVGPEKEAQPLLFVVGRATWHF